MLRIFDFLDGKNGLLLEFFLELWLEGVRVDEFIDWLALLLWLLLLLPAPIAFLIIFNIEKDLNRI